MLPGYHADVGLGRRGVVGGCLRLGARRGALWDDLAAGQRGVNQDERKGLRVWDGHNWAGLAADGRVRGKPSIILDKAMRVNGCCVRPVE